MGRTEVTRAEFARFVQAVTQRHPWLPPALAHRLARAYGSRIDGVIGHAASLADLGAEVAPGLHEAELRFLQRTEWAVSADDVLWRRSKLGLHLDAPRRAAVADWLAAHPADLNESSNTTSRKAA